MTPPRAVAPTPAPPEGASPARNDGELVLQRLVAVDPGDVHVGIAEFVETVDSWECVQAYEMGWESGIDRVAQFLEGGQLNHLVVENFRLYAEQAKAQIGSEFLTAQCIGAIKYLHTLYARRYAAKSPGFRAKADLVECVLELQPASIQKATAAIIGGMGIASEAKGNDHARSAELHGWHYILRKKLGNNEAAWAADGAQ